MGFLDWCRQIHAHYQNKFLRIQHPWYQASNGTRNHWCLRRYSHHQRTVSFDDHVLSYRVGTDPLLGTKRVQINKGAARNRGTRIPTSHGY